jgi:hypothetical protein
LKKHIFVVVVVVAGNTCVEILVTKRCVYKKKINFTFEMNLNIVSSYLFGSTSIISIFAHPLPQTGKLRKTH